MQTINNTNDNAPCEKCGTNLAELGNFIYTGIITNTPTSREEQCKCKHCEEEFIIKYNFFDETGHIQAYVFNEDVNDFSYNWQDQLTPEQKAKIGEHLKSCKTCSECLAEGTLTDAWFAALLHYKKKNNFSL